MSDCCPKCGSPNTYFGFLKTECGYLEECENYTKEQAKFVQEISENEDIYFLEEELDSWDDWEACVPYPVIFTD